jgi:hypothetical protein
MDPNDVVNDRTSESRTPCEQNDVPSDGTNQNVPQRSLLWLILCLGLNQRRAWFRRVVELDPT